MATLQTRFANCVDLVVVLVAVLLGAFLVIVMVCVESYDLR